MSAPRTIISLGFPATGKTTFLASLWQHALSSTVKGALCVEALPTDRKYLNQIGAAWLQCESQSRTRLGRIERTSINLSDSDFSRVVTLEFPDLSGETFMSHWAERQWSLEFDNLVENAIGFLLFVHPEKVIDPTTIAEEIYVSGDVQNGDGPKSDENTKEEVVQWIPNLAPTQVQLVECLQFLNKRRDDAFSACRVAVVVSAWDLLCSEFDTASIYLKKRLPLLNQYLTANIDSNRRHVYGVSAQGGDYKSKKSELLTHANPWERILVADDDFTDHDITRPIRWLLQEAWGGESI
ncbi:MAG: hypothetical protein IH984_08280 [Planctomycetes bacterium]|nr:hypothetical protein [Planctomycetota bacterium]